MQKFEQGENGAVKFNNLTLNRRKNNTAVTEGDCDINNSIKKTPLTAINRFISRLSIAKKINYGYSLAIGIAVLGTTGGMICGDYYQKQAFQL